MKRHALTCAVFALAMGLPSLALAQEQLWVRDPRYGAGPGVRAGDLEVHPALGAEFGYDSNYLLRSGTSTRIQEPVIDTFALHVTPSVTVSTITGARRESEGGGSQPPKVSVQAGISATYTRFFSTGNALWNNLEQPPLAANGNLRLGILPNRVFGADVLADFARTVQPSNVPDLNFDRFSARFGGGFTWTPGEGIFDWRFGYEYSLVAFEDDTPLPGTLPGAATATTKNLSNHSHQINTRGRWRFLPRTAFLYDASASFVRYNESVPGQLDSDPIRARIGVNGLVTSSFALLAMVGWGSSFYKGLNPQQYDGIIAQAELKWFITRQDQGGGPAGATENLSTLAIGYVRDFANSYLGDYYLQNRGYASLSYFLGNRFALSLSGGISAITYPTIYRREDGNRDGIADGGTAPAPPEPGFTTPWYDVTLFGEYRPSSAVGINATLRYSGAGEHELFGVDELKWQRFEAFIGARLFL